MASFTTNTTPVEKPELNKLSAWFFALLEEIARFSPTYRDIMRYNALSDAELAARGMTRADVAQRVFGARMGL
jgi:hypothetical protein